MVRILFCLFAFVISLSSYATGQSGDVVFIDGDEWVLLAKPIETDSVLYHRLKSVLPKERSVSTANWDGYTAYWSINQNQLCLDSIQVSFDDQVAGQYRQACLSNEEMRQVFKDYYADDKITANWIKSDKLRVGQGKIVFYNHDAYERNYEEEIILIIKEGKVTDRKSFHNQIVVDGFTLGDLNSQEAIKEKLPLAIKSYPELEGVKRIVFTFKDISLDSQGKLLDCQVRVVRLFGDKQNETDLHPTEEKLAEEMKGLLKKIHPWKTLLIHGQYVPVDQGRYTLPYILNK